MGHCYFDQAGEFISDSDRPQPNNLMPVTPMVDDTFDYTFQVDNASIETFNTYNFNDLRHFSDDLNLLRTNLTDMDPLDFDHAILELPTPTDDTRHHFFPTTEKLIPLERFKRIQQAWPRKRITPLRLIRNLWQNVIQHKADNIFCRRDDYDAYPSPLPNHQNYSKWNLGTECRDRLKEDSEAFYKPINLQKSPSHVEQSAAISGESPHSLWERSESDQMRSKFPSAEILDIGLDFYFRHFHPLMPFVHQATFDANGCPSSILLPMCLIGLTILDPKGSKEFIQQQWTVCTIIYHCIRLC
jgi:hypothetical protein